MSNGLLKMQNAWIWIDIMRVDIIRIRGCGYADTDTRIRGYADTDTRIRGYGYADTDTDMRDTDMRIRICG